MAIEDLKQSAQDLIQQAHDLGFSEGQAQGSGQPMFSQQQLNDAVAAEGARVKAAVKALVEKAESDIAADLGSIDAI